MLLENSIERETLSFRKPLFSQKKKSTKFRSRKKNMNELDSNNVLDFSIVNHTFTKFHHLAKEQFSITQLILI